VNKEIDMEKIEFGSAGEIDQVDEKCPMDAFENHIRRIGVVAACEWFDHDRNSDFTMETIRVLKERSNA
jgi:hypothetical protein